MPSIPVTEFLEVLTFIASPTDGYDFEAQRFIDDYYVPARIKAQIGLVHVYLHYRGNASKYPHYVALAKVMFPNAAIVAGSYPCDRIDYIACGESSPAKRTPSQEIQQASASILGNEQCRVRCGMVDIRW